MIRRSISGSSSMRPIPEASSSRCNPFFMVSEPGYVGDDGRLLWIQPGITVETTMRLWRSTVLIKHVLSVASILPILRLKLHRGSI